MKITSLFIFSIFISFIQTKAQDITFGIKGGINYSNIGTLNHYGPRGGNNVTPSEDFYYSDNHDSGYHYGGYFKINFNYFYLKPEVVYTSLNNSYDLALEKSEWLQTSLDIGLFFGYRVYGLITIYAGPSISMINDRQLEGNETKGNTPWSYEKTNLGVGLGATIEFGRFGIDLRYLYGLTKVEHIEIDMVRSTYGTNRGALQEYNPGQLILSATIDVFSFGGEKKKRRAGSDWRNHKNL